MLVAVTGATGFIGRYVTNYLLKQGHSVRAWHRKRSDRHGFVKDAGDRFQWIEGQFNDTMGVDNLVRDADAVVNCALNWPHKATQRDNLALLKYAQLNIGSTLHLMERARALGVSRFVQMSSCAVHDLVLRGRVVDETHPRFPTTHYGAMKAAIEGFVHSFGLGGDWDICAIRPAAVYGLARPLQRSRWFSTVHAVMEGRSVSTPYGCKAVHVIDVAKAVSILLEAPNIGGHCYDVCDQYVAKQDVAKIAREIAGTKCDIEELNEGPTSEINTAAIQALGLEYGGQRMLETTIRQLVDIIQRHDIAVPSPHLDESLEEPPSLERPEMPQALA